MPLPADFVYLKDIDASIIQDVKYFAHENFIGRPIKGYTEPTCILTKPAALALAALQKTLLLKQLSLKVFDCYRPQTAVDDFIKWSQDASDQKMKEWYYPNIDKADIFKLGYLSEKSSHTRGSTVDLTLVHLSPTNKAPLEMAMGTPFDFMDERSHVLSPHINHEEQQNRLLLQNFMRQVGFNPYDKEWWHFTLENEPYPDTYFNFPVA